MADRPTAVPLSSVFLVETLISFISTGFFSFLFGADDTGTSSGSGGGPSSESDSEPAAVERVLFLDCTSRYVKAGRKIGGRRRSGPRSGRAIKSTGPAAGYNRETLKSIREWAKKNGHNVSDRGRLSAKVLQAWETAQAGSKA